MLDVQNALVHFQHKPEWKRVKEHGHAALQLGE